MTGRERTTDLHGDAPAAAAPRAVPDRRELAFVAVERTRMPMIVTDPRLPDNPIVLANQAFLDLSGHAADEVIGRNPRFMQCDDTDPAALAELRDAMAHEREAVVELLNRRKDGSRFWNQLFVSPVRDDEGRVSYYFASQLDVTERRKARALEAAERMLLKEVDHRAKNALAIVQGIVRLSDAADARSYARAVQGRVDALARAHALLAAARWRGVSVARLLASEALRHGRERVRCAGPQVQLPAAKVQSFALVLHELATNAARHGALSGEGSIAVEWTQPREDRLVLRWRESGGPPCPAEQTTGFGLRTVRSTIQRQFGGRAELDFAPAGLEAVLEMPI